LCILLFPIFLYAQRDSTYTSLESALSNPDQVYSLFIAYKNIETLPEEIGLLKNLEHLYAFSNKISKLAAIWQEGIGQSKCLDERYLPPADFLAKKLLELYIESSKDWWDIDPGEYTIIKAGYIYFGYSDVRVNETGLVNTEDQLKCIPMLDDTVDGDNVIKSLKELYGNNARLIDLPIKMKLAVSIVLSEAVSPGRGSLIVGGTNGWCTMVFDRDIKGSWTQVFARKNLWDEKLRETKNSNFTFNKFISNLLSKFTLKDLIADY
jgi:Leucine-rich repeat (LRR) protein